MIVQAGASEQGRELAAATADIVYAVHAAKPAAQAFYADIKGRMARYDRRPEHLKILPALRPVVGRTTAEAQAKFDAAARPARAADRTATAQQLVRRLVGLSPRWARAVERPAGLGRAQHRRATGRARAPAENPTIRKLYEDVAGKGGFCLIGTPAEIADVMQDWFESEACDGFNITPTHLPGGCEDFVDLVVPELQRRGLFRREYEGRTLRENLGLPPVVSRYA